MKVLIVDGSRQSRRDMVDALAQLTNVVIQGAVASARTALHALADAPPDLVVTEAALPDGGGAELVEKIQRLARVPSIVVISAAPSDEERNRYLAAGVDRYVERDADYRGLQDAVATLHRGRGVVPSTDTLRLLGRMTAGVVHDLNNYLAAIEGAVTLLQRNPTDQTLWDQLRRGLDATARLNSTLLGYARGAAPEPSALDVGVLVRDVLTTCSRLVPGNVQLTTEIATGLRPVRAVASELEQLVLNLVINACDAMPDGGALHIAVTRTGSAAVHIRVADSGVGLRSHTPRELGGRGLGLGIVHAVVERLRGAVEFAPRGGGGTVVDVMLPAA